MSDQQDVNIETRRIIAYPDPVLRKKCEPVREFGEALERLVERMRFLMHEQNGVGLAGPQVGLPLRIFIWNPTGDPAQDRVSINPVIENLVGQVEAEEGCLSIPDVTVRVKRASTAKLTAMDVDGSTYTLEGENLAARIWQHENDHLDGRLILDYQSPGEEITNRRVLKDLTSKYKRAVKSAKRGGR